MQAFPDLLYWIERRYNDDVTSCFHIARSGGSETNWQLYERRFRIDCNCYEFTSATHNQQREEGERSNPETVSPRHPDTPYIQKLFGAIGEEGGNFWKLADSYKWIERSPEVNGRSGVFRFEIPPSRYYPVCAARKRQSRVNVRDGRAIIPRELATSHRSTSGRRAPRRPLFPAASSPPVSVVSSGRVCQTFTYHVGNTPGALSLRPFLTLTHFPLFISASLCHSLSLSRALSLSLSLSLSLFLSRSSTSSVDPISSSAYKSRLRRRSPRIVLLSNARRRGRLSFAYRKVALTSAPMSQVVKDASRRVPACAQKITSD
nr:PREDICTED: uncharacterized protein LOC105675010 isoform X1 [Linepithema humile]XP_012227171.1 PREDICTED: uncharacterized protein LOC105675010 isoform X2 [Linepithema humile]